jgi:hypothetical protein
MNRSWQLMRDEALMAKGRDWRNAIVTAIVLRKVLPVALVAALLGGLGYLARLVWVSLTSTVTGPAAPTEAAVAVPVDGPTAWGAVPWWLWALAATLTVVLGWLFRPGRITTRSDRRLRLVPLSALALTLLGICGVVLAASTGG